MKFNIDIETYRAKFFGGARSYLFFVALTFPNNQIGLTDKIKGFGDTISDNISDVLGNIEGNIPGLKGGPLSGISSMVGNAVGNAVTGAAMRGAAAAADKVNSALTRFGISSADKLTGGVLGMLGLGASDFDLGYLVKSTYLPESTFQETSTFWMGQEYKQSSTQRFTDWTVTFYIDKYSDIVDRFYTWQSKMRNVKTNEYGNPLLYMSNQQVFLIGMENARDIMCYTLVNAWPKQIGQIQLDYTSNDIAQFDVTFSYQYHTTKKGDISYLDTLENKAQNKLTEGVNRLLNV